MKKEFKVLKAGYIENFRNAITSDDPLNISIEGGEARTLLAIVEMRKKDVEVSGI